MPKASIIITTHNRPALLPRAVSSARASGTDLEIVVVDDASSDQTAEVCKALSNINYVRVERNQRVAGARNIGLVASHGEYLSFLDDDDTRLPDSLDQQIELLRKESSAGLIYGQAIPEDQEGRQQSPYPAECPQGDIFWQLMSRNFIPCGSAVFRRSCLTHVGLLDDGLGGVDDWDLWVRVAEIYPIIAVDTPVIIWRKSTPTSGQGSSRTVDLIAMSRRQLREHWLKLPRAANASRHHRHEAWREFSKNFSEHLVWEATSALVNGEFRKARESALTVLRLHPAGPLAVARRWTRGSTFKTLLASGFSRNELANTREHFKRVRSRSG